MPTSRLIVMVMANICLNIGVAWLFCRFADRRQAAEQQFCRDARAVCQQIRQIAEEFASRKKELL